jgi:hypothetical protein
VDEEVLAMQSREMLADAQSLSEFHETLAVPLVRLEDFPVKAAIEDPDRHDASSKAYAAWLERRLTFRFIAELPSCQSTTLA